MSRADAFDAFYHDSRERLLHQVYAFAGDPDVAKRALADGYVSAAEHWRTASHDPDAEVRVRAFRAVSHRRNRSREPWYERARRIPDAHRPLLAALAGLSAADRHVLIAHHLGGLDLEAAAKEAGVGAEGVAGSVERYQSTLREGGVAPAGVSAALAGLRTGLPTERVNAASRLRARGDRRRRESWLIAAGVVVLAVAICAGSINAARSPDTSVSSTPSPPAPATPTSTPTPSRLPRRSGVPTSPGSPR